MESLFKTILYEEGLNDWKFELRDNSDGIVIFETKTIHSDSKNVALFLHEVAHVLTENLMPPEKHNSIFANCFTRLVNKYMMAKNFNNQPTER